MAKKKVAEKKATKKKTTTKKKATKKKAPTKKPAKKKVIKAERVPEVPEEAAREVATEQEAARKRKEICAEAQKAILSGDATKAKQATKAALDGGACPSDLLSNYLIPIIDEVGRRFDRGDYSLTKLMITTRAAYYSLELITSAAELYDAILTGNAKKSEEVTKAALQANTDPSELLGTYMVPAMDEVGKRFECNEYFVPELLIAARAMKISLALLTPKLAAAGAEPAGRVVIGTVQGDLHDIGKNLVASMLEGGGFEVIDLGVDVPADKFVEAVQEKGGDCLLALSALLTTTMTQMKAVIEALKAAGVRDATKVMIGGAPITQQYANEIGADGYSDNASAAVGLARKLAD